MALVALEQLLPKNFIARDCDMIHDLSPISTLAVKQAELSTTTSAVPVELVWPALTSSRIGRVFLKLNNCVPAL